MTDETNDNIVVNPNSLQALFPNTQRCLTMVTTVIGMFNKDTSKSAKARLRRKQFEIVRRLLFLVMMKNRVILPRIEAVHIITSMVDSITELGASDILKRSFACSD